MRKALVILTITAASSILAEEIHPPKYGYEVVSIHPAEPTHQSSGFSSGPQGGLRARNQTVLRLLAFAYHVEEYQVEGLPGWARSDRFEITLTPDHPDVVPDDAPRAQLDGYWIRNRQRMQAVLRDRFGLVVRAETREAPIYALTVAKGGPKLATAADQRSTFDINRRQEIIAKSAGMKNLAEALSMILGRTVRDETGLEGSYDFKAEFAPDMSVQVPGASGPDAVPAADTGRPSVFTALTEQLGLRLDPKRGPVPVLVVDKVERPSEN